MKLRQAEAEHGKRTETNTDPLLDRQFFAEADDSGKSCQHKVTSVYHREEESTVQYSRKVEIELVVDRNADAAQDHQGDKEPVDAAAFCLFENGSTLFLLGDQHKHNRENERDRKGDYEERVKLALVR